MGPVGNGPDELDAIAEINIVPLVDVMLVLLIIFMVTAPLTISGISVDLPTSKARGAAPDENRIVLSIDKGGTYFFDKVPVPGPGLQETLQAKFQYRDKKELFIRADEGVAYGKVVQAMSAAKLAGVGKLSMLTQPPK